MQIFLVKSQLIYVNRSGTPNPKSFDRREPKSFDRIEPSVVRLPETLFA